jgi:hypothetical protein
VAGKFSANDGDACSDCGAGQSSAVGALVCVDCDAGQMSDAGVECVSCAAGQFSEAGSSGCTSDTSVVTDNSQLPTAPADAVRVSMTIAKDLEEITASPAAKSAFERDFKAGLDEGLLSFSLPIIVYMENQYMDKNYSDE